MTNLLGEHVALVVAAMRAATGNAADFAALGKGLNTNTTKLASAVSSLYGNAAANGFQNLWADHVDALLAYTSGKVSGNGSTTAQAQARLRAFEPSLAALPRAGRRSRSSARRRSRTRSTSTTRCSWASSTPTRPRTTRRRTR